MQDRFNGAARGTDAPFTSAFAITPANATELSERPRAIYIGGAGNLSVKFPGSDVAVTFIALPVGTVLHIRPSHVMSTSTTATNLLALV